MDEWTFGITMTVVGTAGTFLTLALVIFLTVVLKKIFPVSPKPESKQT